MKKRIFFEAHIYFTIILLTDVNSLLLRLTIFSHDMMCWSEKVKKKASYRLFLSSLVTLTVLTSCCDGLFWEKHNDFKRCEFFCSYNPYTVINLAHMKILTWEKDYFISKNQSILLIWKKWGYKKVHFS